MDANIRTIGILGAGKLGIVLSQLAIKAGYLVYISGSGGSEKIALSVSVLAPGAKAASSEDVVHHSDIIILALPLGKYRDIPKDLLSDKLVIDAMNYWWEIDGVRDDLTDLLISSSEVVQKYLTGSRVVKALNHIGYHNLHDEAKAEGLPHRKAIAIAGDSATDVRSVAAVVNSLGFDPLIAGTLSQSISLQPGSDVFGANVDKEKLRHMLDHFAQSKRGKAVAEARNNNMDT